MSEERPCTFVFEQKLIARSKQEERDQIIAYFEQEAALTDARDDSAATLLRAAMLRHCAEDVRMLRHKDNVIPPPETVAGRIHEGLCPTCGKKDNVTCSNGYHYDA